MGGPCRPGERNGSASGPEGRAGVVVEGTQRQKMGGKSQYASVANLATAQHNVR